MAVAGAEASVTGLADRISTVLDGLLEPGTEVALVNFPNIANVGDAAIWLGTRRALEAGGIRVLHMCEPATYSPRLVARAVGEHGTILLQGGGNLGDAYVPQHSVRERVLADFPRARVIQLPQTVWFRDPARVERFRRLAEAHSDLTLMLRERRSLEWAQAELQVPAVLCPDMAFALGALERAEPTCDLLWLSRRDGESRGEKLPALGPSERREDWRARTLVRQPGGKRLGAWLALNRRAVPVAAADGRLSGLASAAAAATFAPLARARLGAGITLLSRGRVVVTDRLHGHILALLLGIPNVLLDNSYGKCRDVWETWTEGLPGASWATDPDSALMAARELLATEGGGMRLALTLLVRDEEDILAANLDYHLARGVDLVIATDNGSVDATPDILCRYERRGILRHLHEPRDDYAQAEWVTRMARLAAAEGADWVINCDADEFWWPLDAPDLRAALAPVPDEVAMVRAQRRNFPPRPVDGRPFLERMLLRDVDSRNPRGRPLRAKVAHRAHPEARVGMGNHSVSLPGAGGAAAEGEIEILHFPMRTYPQFENKIVKGGRALNRATDADRSGGGTWRELYALWERGELREHYESAVVPPGPAANGYVEDTRLSDFMAGLPAREDATAGPPPRCL